MRLPNWKVIYEILGERPPEKVLNSMYSQYRYLIKAQETHLLGNHYFENLKTLVIFSLYFKEMDPFRIFWKKLKTEIREQILSDGIHFERSMMYHKIIMEDILGAGWGGRRFLMTREIMSPKAAGRSWRPLSGRGLII